jgi:hypothetical protein
LVSNSFANKAINTGISQPPVIADSPFETAYTMSFDTEGYHNSQSPYRTITFKGFDGTKECEAQCLIDGQCSSYGMVASGDSNQCNLYANDNSVLVRDPLTVSKLKIPRDVNFILFVGLKSLVG